MIVVMQSFVYNRSTLLGIPSDPPISTVFDYIRIRALPSQCEHVQGQFSDPGRHILSLFHAREPSKDIFSRLQFYLVPLNSNIRLVVNPFVWSDPISYPAIHTNTNTLRS